MNLDDAIQSLQARITAISPSAKVKVFKISAEEGRLSIYVPLAEMEALRDAMFQPTLDLLNNEGMDVQIFIYDKDAPPLEAGD